MGEAGDTLTGEKRDPRIPVGYGTGPSPVEQMMALAHQEGLWINADLDAITQPPKPRPTPTPEQVARLREVQRQQNAQWIRGARKSDPPWTPCPGCGLCKPVPVPEKPVVCLRVRGCPKE